jgi:hypothetical protein
MAEGIHYTSSKNDANTKSGPERVVQYSTTNLRAVGCSEMLELERRGPETRTVDKSSAPMGKNGCKPIMSRGFR